MPPISTAHPYELTFAATAGLALILSAWLFTLKLSDLLMLKRAGRNGPSEYLAKEKIRHQGFMVGVTSGMLMLAVSGIHNQAEPTSQTLNLLAGGAFAAGAIVIDALFTFRRRHHLPILIAVAEHRVRGGRRATDLD